MMEQENSQVERGLKETKEAYRAFKAISQAMGDVNEKVVEVSSSVEKMIEASSHILDSIAKAKEIAEKSFIIVKRVLQRQKSNLQQWKR